MNAHPLPLHTIGLDFDNTLVDYDPLFAEVARERGWLAPEAAFPGRIALRTHLRALPAGEEHWQDLQVAVYAERMAAARLAPGATTFIRRCRAEGVALCIISHKTRHAPRDPRQTDLRQTAWTWMEEQGFFTATSLGFHPEEIDFAATRAEKLARLEQRQCTHFVDDLVEVLTDPAFPRTTRGILYCPATTAPPPFHGPICRSWHELTDHLFPR
ncbi:MAG: hypothetical protein HQL66_07130 [Magnetococcales bacterium]|nr:hypothetical protein [Magnetococcales bacterium]